MDEYRKRPIIVKAEQWKGEFTPELLDALQLSSRRFAKTSTGDLLISTLEGTMRADKGDYIIFGVDSEPYPCKPDIFEKTYEKVKEEKKVRMAICGPHGVGKTTLAKRIANEFNMWYISEVARELLDMAKDRNWETFTPAEVYEFQKAILHSHLFYIKQANRLNVDFVSDRSIFDIFAYIDWHKKHRGLRLDINYRSIDIDSYLTLIDKIVFFKFQDEDTPNDSQQWIQQRLEKLLFSDLVSDIVIEINRKTKFEDIIQLIQ